MRRTHLIQIRSHTQFHRLLFPPSAPFSLYVSYESYHLLFHSLPRFLLCLYIRFFYAHTDISRFTRFHIVVFLSPHSLPHAFSFYFRPKHFPPYLLFSRPVFLRFMSVNYTAWKYTLVVSSWILCSSLCYSTWNSMQVSEHLSILSDFQGSFRVGAFIMSQLTPKRMLWFNVSYDWQLLKDG